MSRKRDSSGRVRAKPSSKRAGEPRFSELAATLVEIGRGFYARGWALGTSGNFSAVVSREPLRLAITSTGLDKGKLAAEQILEVDEFARVVRGSSRPSAEALVHLAIVRVIGAGAVLHTHSVWSTILSGQLASKGGVTLEGYEMLKGLDGIQTHEHREWLPIVENSQDMVGLSQAITAILAQQPGIHGILLRGHGLYTWGSGLEEAKRHVEILEFLLEVLARSGTAGHRA